MDIDDYRQYQIEMQRIAGEYEIPFDEEIKWSDLWRKTKNNPRNDLIARMPLSRLSAVILKIHTFDRPPILWYDGSTKGMEVFFMKESA